MVSGYTTAFTIHLHLIGPTGLARPGLRMGCFQDADSEQRARLGFSIRELRSNRSIIK